MVCAIVCAMPTVTADDYRAPFPMLPYLPGDVSADMAIDSSDARLVLQSEVGLIALEELASKAADFNIDGDIDSTDARLILQYEVGLVHKVVPYAIYALAQDEHINEEGWNDWYAVRDDRWDKFRPAAVDVLFSPITHSDLGLPGYYTITWRYSNLGEGIHLMLYISYQNHSISNPIALTWWDYKEKTLYGFAGWRTSASEETLAAIRECL